MATTTATATLALAMGLGSLVWLVCHKLRIPALIPLMAVGALLGRSGLGVVDPALLGGGLGALVSISVALLVFEGSLHLDAETLGHAPRAARGLLTIGALVTWVGVAGIAMVALGLSVPHALLLGAMLIVTGPTVIQPLLARVRLTPRLHAALLTEGILIDPIGVIATVTTLEIVLIGLQAGPTPGTLEVLWLFLFPFVTGTASGLIVGLATRWILSRTSRFGHEGDRTSSMLAIGACVVGAGAAELVRHEAGLVAAAVAGLVVARSLKRQLQPARRASESLAAVLVGILFILLAATFDIESLIKVSWREAAFVGAIIVLVRPISVLLSTFRSTLSLRERSYIALIAPRGIVAVSAAALVKAAMTGASDSPENVLAAAEIENAVLLVVIVTVLWTGFGGGPLAALLGVRGKQGSGMIIVGAGRLGRDLATELDAAGIPARLVDTSAGNCAIAEAHGLDVRAGDATDIDWLSSAVVGPEHGGLLSVTGNADVDRVAARWGVGAFGRGRSVALADADADALAVGLEHRPAAGADRPRPRSLTVHDLVEMGRLRVVTARKAEDLLLPIVWIKGGKVLALGDLKNQGADAVIGLAASAFGGTLEPAAAKATGAKEVQT